MKRIVFLAVVLALLCFAMPAIASPPGGLLALEVSSLAVGMPSVYVAPEVAPVVAIALGIAESATSVSASALEASILLIVIFATVAMLAGLMRGASSSGNRLSKTSFDPRKRLHRLARDQTALA